MLNEDQGLNDLDKYYNFLCSEFSTYSKVLMYFQSA